MVEDAGNIIFLVYEDEILVAFLCAHKFDDSGWLHVNGVAGKNPSAKMTALNMYVEYVRGEISATTKGVSEVRLQHSVHSDGGGDAWSVVREWLGACGDGLPLEGTWTRLVQL